MNEISNKVYGTLEHQGSLDHYSLFLISKTTKEFVK